METLAELNLWHDLLPRSGALNMAMDQLLLETISDLPVLRFYSWDRPSVSFGYFESLDRAHTTFNDLKRDFIRRWTGGGIVDHCIDLTYTLAIPRSHPWAALRGAESYQIIHEAVAKALNETGTTCELISENTGNGSAACFANPVTHDIVTPTGDKLAGAGQKRTRHGLLHQGSVIGITELTKWKESFAHSLTRSVTPWTPGVSFFDRADDLAEFRYATQGWINKRP
jgi:lipoate-protein ligase A